MKYLRSFNESTSQEIDIICKKYGIEHYTINDDGSIDVNGDVFLSDKRLSQLPLTFRNISNNFYCRANFLTSLKGCPKYIGEDFFCYNNQLISLEYAPEYVGGDFVCYDNLLTSLKGIPKKINGILDCKGNIIKNLDYFPNNFTKLYIDNNPITNILKLFIDYTSYISEIKDKDLIYDFIDREIIQNDIVIIDRLVEFLEDIGKPYSKEELYELLKKDYTIR